MPSSQRYGASVEEWIHFDVILGLGADLLPVVSNPTAPISEASKLKALGKTPSRYDRDRKVVGMPGWTDAVVTESDLARWAREPDYGICVRTGGVVALDIDIDDPILADDCKAAVELVLGVEFPVRARPDSGRLLLVFKPTEHDPIAKRVMMIPGEGAVELLGKGQQFVACGTHPKGRRYEWLGGLPDDIPEASADAVWSVVRDFAAPVGGSEITSRSAAPRQSGADVAKPDPAADYLKEKGLALGGNKQYVLVECPWKDDHTSGETGDSSTVWFRAGSNGYGTGAFRCLHAHCAGRSTQEFLDAIGYVEDVAAEFPMLAPDAAPEGLPATRKSAAALSRAALPVSDVAGILRRPSAKLADIGEGLRTKAGKVAQSLDNIQRIVSKPGAIGMEFVYDDFTSAVMWRDYDESNAPLEGWKPLRDEDIHNAAVRIASKFKFDNPSRDSVRQAIYSEAYSRTVDFAAAWLMSLPWDGVPRIGKFMHEYLGAEDSEYAAAVGAYLWTALAGRVMSPGVKADMMPVFIGGQGISKSTAIARMVADRTHYVVMDFTAKEDDLIRKMHGVLVAEVSELDGLHTRSVEFIKRFLSTDSDRWVPKYQETARDRKRRTIMIGTTNNDQFLSDTTGNRRILPIDVGVTGDIELARIAREALQLWAEGREIFIKFGVQYSEAESLATNRHKEHMVDEVIAEPVDKWLRERNVSAGYPEDGKVTTKAIAWGALGIPPVRVTPLDKKKIQAAMTSLGYAHVKLYEKGRLLWLWEPIGLKRGEQKRTGKEPEKLTGWRARQQKK